MGIICTHAESLGFACTDKPRMLIGSDPSRLYLYLRSNSVGLCFAVGTNPKDEDYIVLAKNEAFEPNICIKSPIWVKATGKKASGIFIVNC